jgi:hypothetical protein
VSGAELCAFGTSRDCASLIIVSLIAHRTMATQSLVKGHAQVPIKHAGFEIKKGGRFEPEGEIRLSLRRVLYALTILMH